MIKNNKRKIIDFYEKISQIISIDSDNKTMVGLSNDGHVFGTGSNENRQLEGISSWTNIKKVICDNGKCFGIKSDGTVVFAGNGSKSANYPLSDTSVGNWKDIVDIAKGSQFTVGLKKDGTLVAVGNDKYHACNVSGFRNVVEVVAGGDYTAVMLSDGTVRYAGAEQDNSYVKVDYRYNTSSWQNVVKIVGGFKTIYGITEDGRVYAEGRNQYGECNVSNWRDIVAVYPDFSYAIGLKYDGTVVTTDEKFAGVRNWKDIVYVSTDMYAVTGVTANGKVLICGKVKSSVKSFADSRKNIAIAKIINGDLVVLDFNGHIGNAESTVYEGYPIKPYWKELKPMWFEGFVLCSQILMDGDNSTPVQLLNLLDSITRKGDSSFLDPFLDLCKKPVDLNKISDEIAFAARVMLEVIIEKGSDGYITIEYAHDLAEAAKGYPKADMILKRINEYIKQKTDEERKN